MKFCKLLLRDVPKKGDTFQWRLIIDHEEDLAIHHHNEAYAYYNALIGLAKQSDAGELRTDHLGGAETRQIALARLLRCKQETLKEGEKAYPIIETARIVDEKYLAQLRHIRNHGAIKINEAGGWSGLYSFLKTWNGEIIETVEKQTAGFPTDMEALTADTICLENSHPEYAGDYTETKARREFGENAGVVSVIFNLKEMDIDYVIASIKNAKNIYISTQLQDGKQFDAFMKIFASVPKKNIVVEVHNYASKKQIESHPLFHTVNSIHSITIK